MEGEPSGTAKRAHDDSGEPGDSPRAKRLHAAADRILLDILDDVDSVDRGPAAGDLANVMKSFEEEIAALCPCLQTPQQQQLVQDAAEQISASSSSDLGYLLEASDDELGLPPTLPPSLCDEGGAADGGPGEGADEGLEELGQLWAFDDGAPGCYDGLGFGGLAGGDDVDGLPLDGDLFGYPDVASSGPSEFSDFSWRPESLPAV